MGKHKYHKTDLEVGKTYEVYHEHKGNFKMEILEIGEAFIHGIYRGGNIVQLVRAEPEVGDELSVRRSFCSFKLLTEGAE